MRREGFFTGEMILCRRKTSRKNITSDQRGFAGVRPPTTLPPPANILSPELISRAHRCLAMSALLIGAGSFLRLRFCRRRKTSQKIITSDHRGFAGVQLPAMLPPPASIRSPELSSQAQRGSPISALLSSEFTCPPRISKTISLLENTEKTDGIVPSVSITL